MKTLNRAVDLSLHTLEGTAGAFVGERHSKTLSHVRGCANFAVRCGASRETLAETCELAIRRAYRPDWGRVAELRALLSSL